MSTARRDLRTSGDLVMAPRVPHGLAAAVEGLTREVIRHRPEDIYVFAAQHFEELLKLRDEYGAVTNLPGRSTNTAALREMNQSLKKRSGTEKSVSKPSRERGGWSMNETARVLERHRSIFGDKGKKVSPDEVRALENEKENKSRHRDDLEKFANKTNQKRRGSNERFVRRRIPPKDAEPHETKSKSDSNGNPKIISQIPTLNQSTGLLAKDIKSELRKNRNSSKDGRSIRARAEKKPSDRTDRFEIAARHSGATRKPLMRSSRERSLDKLIDVEKEAGDVYTSRIETDNQKQKTDVHDWSKSFSKMPRTLSMDRVREYVVQKFRSSESWEELRSTNYVDRVQEVIDEASPSILRRVKELSTRSAGRSRGYESVDESTSTSTRSDKSNQTDDIRSRSAMTASRRSRRSTRKSKSKSKSKTSCADSLEGIETLASEAEQLKEIRNEIEKEKDPAKSSANCLSGESDVSDYAEISRKVSASSSISLPAVRPPSSKNPSRSVSRSEADNLVLPPIPPEAPRSTKHREELILPSLSIPKEILKGVENREGEVLLEDTTEVELNLPDAPTDEIFKDSLNVTPEIAASPRPDSLEPPDGGGTRNDQPGDNIDELKSKLNDIDSGTDSERINVAHDVRRVEEIEENVGMKERLREIEETEMRIEKMLRNEVQETRGENPDATSVKEKLIEIQEAEKRLRSILDPGAEEKEIQHLEGQEIPKEVNDLGMKEKLMEIEETEKRIEKILDSEGQEIQEDVKDVGIKEKLMEIEETEKRIAKILHPESQEIEKDLKDVGMKEKLIEIEETEKRIEQIFHSEVQEIQNDKTEAGFMKVKLMEIEEAEKRLKNVFNSTSGKEEKINPVLRSPKDDNNSAPKTPFIPEIPSEYVTAANQVNATEEEAKQTEETVNQFPEQAANPEDTNEEFAQRNEVRPHEAEAKIEQFSSGTPDSLGNSYVLTEGSPYDIPDSVTTVIIPERQLDTPSSDVLEIVLEDDLGESKKSFNEFGSEGFEENLEKESRDVSLRNILDNFGEIVHQETVPGSSLMDVDFIKNLKTLNEVVIARKGLGLITEEEDKDIAETDVIQVFKDAVTPALDDIVESEEILEVDEAQGPPSTKSLDSGDGNHEPGHEKIGIIADGASGDRKTDSPEPLETKAEPEEVENLENSRSINPEDRTPSQNGKPRSLENLEPEITSPTTTAIGLLQYNVTDSATTESTDEVKETTISDDGGNTAVESSVTSPSCGDEMGARNSESSNEVKETTISDRPADEIGKNLFSLVPQCYGSMPHVPELNLDSLQDITVSSFQLSDDVTAEEDSEAGQPQSETEVSLTTGSEDARASQKDEPVQEEIIVKERVAVKEDPCTKVIAFVTEPDTEDIEPKSVAIQSNKESEVVLTDNGEEVSEEVIEELAANVAEKRSEEVPRAECEEVRDEIITDRIEKIPQEELEEVHETVANVVREEILEEVVKDTAKKVSDREVKEECDVTAKDVAEEDHEKKPENTGKMVFEEEIEEVHKEEDKKIPDEEREDASKKVSEETPDVIVENVPQETAGEVLEQQSKKLPEEIIEEKAVEVLSEQGTKVDIVESEEVIRRVPEQALVKKPEEVQGELAAKVPKDEPEQLEKKPEKVHEKLASQVAEEEPVDVINKVPEEVLLKKLEEVYEEQAKQVPEEVPKQLVEGVARMESKEVLAKKSEDIHEQLAEEEPVEVGKMVSKELLVKKPEEAHEKLAEKISEEEPEAVANKISEEKRQGLVKEVSEMEPEEVLEEKLEEIHEDLAKKIPEDVVEEVSGVVIEELVKKVPQEKTEELVKAVAETKLTEKLEKEPEEVYEVVKKLSEEVFEDLPKKVSEEVPEEVAKELFDEKPKAVNEEPGAKPEKEHENLSKNSPQKNPEELSEAVVSKPFSTEMETTSLQDFKALEALVVEEYSKENIEVDKNANNSAIRVPAEVPAEVPVSMTQEEKTGGLLTPSKTDESPVELEPPKAEVVTNDLERMEYHIYVPEVTTSEDNSTTESSTFNSAATKIQAGVRGFLTRRRLQSAQRRSSTLDSVPSIQDSFAADVPHLEPIEEVGLAQAATTIQSSYRGYKARKRLRREDAVQKTTMSVENSFCGNGLQHTGEFHDCLPLPPFENDHKKPEASRSDGNIEISTSEEKDIKTHENPELITESTTTKEESVDDDSTFGLLDKEYPYSHQGLNVVVFSGNDAFLQSQYLNFITSIEEVHNEADSLVPDQNIAKVIEGFSTMKSNAGIESLPLDDLETDTSIQDSSVSIREPLAVPGTPTTLIIEELSKTDEESIPVDGTSANSSANVDTNLNNEGPGDSLDLPGLSLEGNTDPVNSGVGNSFEISKPGKVTEETPISFAPDVAQDASLGTMSFSMNVDDMLGLGGESDPSSKMKPILEVTVTPRDLLKLTNRSQGSQVSGDRVESPVTMMQIVPKSVDDKSDRSEEEKEKHEERVKTELDDEIKREEGDKNPKIDSAAKKSTDDEEASDGTSRTFSIEKN